MSNRQEWVEIAKALGSIRKGLLESWPPKGGYSRFASVIHDRKLIYHAQLDGFDRAARALCHVLKKRSSRFDGERFLRLIGIV